MGTKMLENRFCCKFFGFSFLFFSSSPSFSLTVTPEAKIYLTQEVKKRIQRILSMMSPKLRMGMSWTVLS
jgi:hypothetical protein